MGSGKNENFLKKTSFIKKLFLKKTLEKNESWQVKMKIGIDLDEVIVEFVRGYLKLYNLKYKKNILFENIFSYNLWESLGISKEEAVQLADEYYTSEDFENIEFVKDVKESLQKLSKNNKLFIITSRHVKIKEKTKIFLKKIFPLINFEVIHSGDFFDWQGKSKAEICMEKGLDVFIEDRKEYALECAKKKIKVFLLDKPWNRNVANENMTRVYNWNEILDKIGEEKNAKLFS